MKFFQEKQNVRILWLFSGTAAVFLLLAFRLYQLQIVHGEEYRQMAVATIVHQEEIKAVRGEIYDRYGRPLAVNRPVYQIKMDLSVLKEGNNDMLLELLEVFEENKIEMNDTFPVSSTEPYEFLFSSQGQERLWKRDMGFQEDEMDASPEETIEKLEEFFEIPETLPKKTRRDLLALRSEIYLHRFRKYQSVVLASDVKMQEIALFEENKDRFPAIFIEADGRREYPYGESMSHILGYLGSINEEELEEHKEEGYAPEDKIGKLGIEKSFESLLRGSHGEKRIEVNASGMRVGSWIETEAKQGGDVYLTIDANLQEKVYRRMEETLKELLLEKLGRGSVTVTDVFCSLLENQRLAPDLFEKEKNLPESVKKAFQEEKTAEHLMEEAADGRFSDREMIDCLILGNVIRPEEETKDHWEQGEISPTEMIKTAIDRGEIKVHEVNADPCTGSAVVVDVNTGEVLSMVSYPSYDNNRLTGKFDHDYYKRLLADPTTPLLNRPTMERKAPGSIFKMIPALAGLETGVITKDTVIYDKGIYREAGKPYPSCLIYSNYGSTHGPVTVEKAIEVSCNYFFYELARRFGNDQSSSAVDSITLMDEYMYRFGLYSKSGIEIEEYEPRPATPEQKRTSVKAYDPEAPEGLQVWTDGDSVRCAIGQSYNNFAPIHMAKYMASLANGEKRYRLTLWKKTVQEGKEVWHSPVVEEYLNLSKENVACIHRGMRRVVNGERGTLRTHFQDFPYTVAAKTGTAEEDKSRASHSWFAGFAPYESPQIAVVVQIPFGEGKEGPAIRIAKEIIQTYLDEKGEKRDEMEKE